MTQIDLLAPIVMPEKGTQHYTLLMAMQRGERLTVLTALQQYQVYALSQRVGELKRDGWPIRTQMVKTPTGKTIAEYRLEQE